MEDMSCPWSDTVVNSTSLEFEVDEGWAYNPPAQWLRLEKALPSGRAANWNAVVNQPWLGISPEAGAVPKRVRVDAASVGMAAGTYQAEIRFTSHVNVTPSIIPVTLTVKGEQPPPPPPTLVCPHCGAEFTNEEDRQKHVDQEHPPPPPAHRLSISSRGGGSVPTPGQGSFRYAEGTIVDLVAEPWENWRFLNWIGDVATLADVRAATTTITMRGDCTIIANFEEIPPPEPEGNWLVQLIKRILDWLGILRKED